MQPLPRIPIRGGPRTSPQAGAGGVPSERSASSTSTQDRSGANLCHPPHCLCWRCSCRSGAGGESTADANPALGQTAKNFFSIRHSPPQRFGGVRPAMKPALWRVSGTRAGFPDRRSNRMHSSGSNSQPRESRDRTSPVTSSWRPPMALLAGLRRGAPRPFFSLVISGPATAVAALGSSAGRCGLRLRRHRRGDCEHGDLLVA